MRKRASLRSPTEIRRLALQLRRQGPRRTFWAAIDKLVRWISGGPWERFSRITDQVWLGGQPTGRGRRRLARLGITGIVNLRDEHDYARHIEGGPFRYLHLPTVDLDAPSLDHLRQGSAFIRRELEAGGKVFIHCWEGLGRGPTLAAAHFIERGASAEEAVALVLAVRPFIRLTDEQCHQLERFETDLAESRPPSSVDRREARANP